MCSDPLDPGGEVRGCSVAGTLDMSDISPFRVAAVLNVHREFPELKKMHFESGVFWVRWDFVFFLRFISSNAHGLLQACIRSPSLIYLSTSTGVRTGCHYLISLSVCVYV